MTNHRSLGVGLIRRRWEDPLRRSADALILGTAVTSLLGLAFWALAARWIPTEALGIGAALISVVALLANFSTLGMRNGFLRFLPIAGPGTRRFIGVSYLVCACAALLAGTIFLLGQPVWADKLGFLRESPLTIGLFVLSIAVWVIFVLQDQVLIGLRHAGWVPLENGVASVLKILALPLVAASTGWAIYAATLIPALLVVLLVSALIIGKTRHLTVGAGTTQQMPRVSPKQVLRFVIPDHFASLLWFATTDVLTLVVLHLRGAEASAYWFLANTVGYSLYLVTSNVGSALIAESVHDPQHVAQHARKALKHSAQLVIPAALLGILLAPWALGILGADYADNATGTLQFILASTIPQLIVGIGLSTARIRGDMRTVLGIYVFTALMLWGGASLALQLWGLTGLGVLILLNQLIIALYLLLSGRSGLSNWTQWITFSSLASLGARAWRQMRMRFRSRALVPLALRHFEIPVLSPTQLLTSDTETLVLSVPGPATDKAAHRIMKIAISAEASQSLDVHVQVLEYLHSELSRMGLAGNLLRTKLPVVLEKTELNEHLMVLESKLGGLAVAKGQRINDEFSGATLGIIGQLHLLTGSKQHVNPADLDSWVDEPLRLVASMCSTDADFASTAQISTWLKQSWRGACAQISFVHGDLWTGNVLVENSGSICEVSGFVDWETGSSKGLPDTDLIHWWLCAQPGELGETVVRVFDHPDLLLEDFARWGVKLSNESLGIQQLIIQTWLIHVSAGIKRVSINHVPRYWFFRNVMPVLDLFSAASVPSTVGDKS